MDVGDVGFVAAGMGGPVKPATLRPMRMVPSPRSSVEEESDSAACAVFSEHAAAPAAEEGLPEAAEPTFESLHFVSSTRPASTWALHGVSRADSPSRLRRAGSTLEPLQRRAQIQVLDLDVVAATALAHAAEAVCSEHPSRLEKARLRSERKRDEEMQRALSEWQLWSLSVGNALCIEAADLHCCTEGARDSPLPRGSESQEAGGSGEEEEEAGADEEAAEKQEEATAAEKEEEEQQQKAETAEAAAALLRAVDIDLARTLPQLQALFAQSAQSAHSAQPALGRSGAQGNTLGGGGYVQGMTFVAALVLLYAESELAALTVFANLMQREDVLSALFALHDELFRLALPRLHARFERAGVCAEQFLLDWCLTLFARVTVRLWDMVLLEGDAVLSYAEGDALVAAVHATALPIPVQAQRVQLQLLKLRLRGGVTIKSGVAKGFGLAGRMGVLARKLARVLRQRARAERKPAGQLALYEDIGNLVQNLGWSEHDLAEIDPEGVLRQSGALLAKKASAPSNNTFEPQQPPVVWSAAPQQPAALQPPPFGYGLLADTNASAPRPSFSLLGAHSLEELHTFDSQMLSGGAYANDAAVRQSLEVFRPFDPPMALAQTQLASHLQGPFDSHLASHVQAQLQMLQNQQMLNEMLLLHSSVPSVTSPHAGAHAQTSPLSPHYQNAAFQSAHPHAFQGAHSHVFQSAHPHLHLASPLPGSGRASPSAQQQLQAQQLPVQQSYAAPRPSLHASAYVQPLQPQPHCQGTVLQSAHPHSHLASPMPGSGRTSPGAQLLQRPSPHSRMPSGSTPSSSYTPSDCSDQTAQAAGTFFWERAE
ncbi:rab-GTPase-TBC domain-containing protein [Pavlovales sp. CCMP2436]|nr:rab-GTPase-TBC domain-containing protein [Pavlovales sp. CCMP2436]